ncbi:MAG: Rrf2 family transcriptional regulator [Nitrospirae bacterium]|nr:Rrf2 family transcriptional regulator [Nitrospirota bacterium]
MRFSVKSEYAVTAVLDVAGHSDKGPVHVRSIAGRHAIPVRFLEQVMASLKKAGIVDSIRGAQGGYVLARDPRAINIAQIIEAIEGPITPVDSMADSAESMGARMNGHVVRDVWDDVKRAISNVLNGVTIEDLNRKVREKDVSVMYHI